MAKKAAAKTVASSLRLEKSGHRPDTTQQKPSALLDIRAVYCGDNLEQLAKLPNACVDLIYMDPSFNSNREIESFVKRSHKARHPDREGDFRRTDCEETGLIFYHEAKSYFGHHSFTHCGGDIAGSFQK
jgi:hypothetical protein